jgi:hypothetical protein
MSHSMLSVRPMTALAVIGLLAFFGRAESAGAAELLDKTYDIRWLPQQGGPALLQLCQSVIDPASWQSNGGEATMSVVGGKLSVKQTAAAQKNLSGLPDSLRKLPKRGARGVPREKQIVVGTQKSGDGEFQIAIYPVGDLTGKKSMSEVAEQIQSTIEPNSWTDNGGMGEIVAYPISPALIVSNTKNAQDKIGDLLAGMRPGGKPRAK